MIKVSLLVQVEEVVAVGVDFWLAWQFEGVVEEEQEQGAAVLSLRLAQLVCYLPRVEQKRSPLVVWEEEEGRVSRSWGVVVLMRVPEEMMYLKKTTKRRELREGIRIALLAMLALDEPQR